MNGLGMGKKRIVNIVLNDFTSDSRVYKTCRTLGAIGYLVKVVALHNEGCAEKEIVGNFSVHRVKLFTRSWPKILPIQFVKYFEFMFIAFKICRNQQVCHCHDLNALPIGLMVKIFRKNIKVIYDCHEYQTERHGVKGFAKVLSKFGERFMIKFADEIITVSDSIALEYSRLYNIEKPHLVLNCPPFKEQKKRNIFRDKFLIRSDQKIFIYQGALTKGRGIEILLESFSKMESDRNVLVIMGYGVLEPFIRNMSLYSDNIFFHPAVHPDVLLDYTGSADYGVSFIEDSCLNHRFCAPNKIFEYLMAGLPIITSNLFEIKRLVDAENIGVTSSENTVLGFTQAVEVIRQRDYSEIQQNVFQVRRKFCWENQEKVLRDIYYGFN